MRNQGQKRMRGNTKHESEREEKQEWKKVKETEKERKGEA